MGQGDNDRSTAARPATASAAAPATTASTAAAPRTGCAAAPGDDYADRLERPRRDLGRARATTSINAVEPYQPLSGGR